MMNPSTEDGKSLLTTDELDALLKRKAEIQASIQTKAAENASCGTGAGSCPSCQCSTGAATSSAPRHGRKILLAVMLVLALALFALAVN